MMTSLLTNQDWIEALALIDEQFWHECEHKSPIAVVMAGLALSLRVGMEWTKDETEAKEMIKDSLLLWGKHCHGCESQEIIACSVPEDLLTEAQTITLGLAKRSANKKATVVFLAGLRLIMSIYTYAKGFDEIVPPRELLGSVLFFLEGISYRNSRVSVH